MEKTSTRPVHWIPEDLSWTIPPRRRYPRTTGGKNPCCEIVLPGGDICWIGRDVNAMYVDRHSV